MKGLNLSSRDWKAVVAEGNRGSQGGGDNEGHCRAESVWESGERVLWKGI